MKFLLSTRQHDPVSMALTASEVGFYGIELVMPNRRDETVGKEIPRNGITHADAIHAPNDYYDEIRFRSALWDAIQVAILKKATIVTIHPASAAPKFGGRQNVEACIALLKEAQRQYPGITLCYEVLAKPTKRRHELEKAYKSPADWCADVLKYGLAATLDTTHIASWGEDPAKYIRLLGNHVRHVHLSDYLKKTGEQHLFPKDGDIDWASVFFALEEINNPNLMITFEPSGKFDLKGRKEKVRLQKSLQFAQAFLF